MNKIDEKLVINNNKVKSLLNFCTALHKITNSFLLRPPLSLLWNGWICFMTGWGSQNKSDFSRYDKFGNPRYGYLWHSGHDLQSHDKKNNAGNCKVFCVWRKLNYLKISIYVNHLSNVHFMQVLPSCKNQSIDLQRKRIGWCIYHYTKNHILKILEYHGKFKNTK